MTDEQALALRAKMLGATLRLARLSAGRSLKELAGAIGVSPRTLSSYEASRKSISLPELEMLAFHLGMPLQRFWAQAGPAAARPAVNPAALLPLRQRMLGAQVRAQRTAAQLSIREAAEHIGIPPSRLSAGERGDRPIPLPQLEALARLFGRPITDYLDSGGPVGEWHASQRALEALQELPADLRDFLIDPANRTYLRLAKRLSELSVDRLRMVAEGLLDLTL